jgi:hypothetical protein
MTCRLKRLRRYGPYGPRGWAMLVLALAALGRAADYLRPARVDSAPFVLREFASFLPVQVWGILWGFTGVVVLVSAFRKRQGFALGILASMSMIWAVIYTATAAFGWAGDDTLRAWQGALGFLAFFVIVVALSRMINPVRIRDVPYA